MQNVEGLILGMGEKGIGMQNVEGHSLGMGRYE